MMKENQTSRNIFEITISVSICLKEIGQKLNLFWFKQFNLYVEYMHEIHNYYHAV